MGEIEDMDTILQENIASLNKVKDKIQRGLDEFNKAIAELERLGNITKNTWNDSNSTACYNEAARMIPIERLAAVNKLLAIGVDAIQEYNNLGGQPMMVVKELKGGL